ncbi:MAG: type II secretion system F family protein [Xanthobacteraceae bacterium]|mgnify:CR=1 FL=1|nr:type II secretion system F family protein [Xanthobacteraceae bacterium]QYK45216.1 MAG: type II secretion system F family protein [Xanthobacteraceae bacterium]HMN50573.1 type II secretion system F family protein [Xanthobacteraceae bacterium]
MPFELDQIHLFYFLAAVSAIVFAEAIYLFFYNKASYRSHLNRRLSLMKHQPNREHILVQLRRERSLSAHGAYASGLISLNRLVLQSGARITVGRFIVICAVLSVATFGGVWFFRESLLQAILAAGFAGFILPMMVLRSKRNRRHKAFGAQFPDAIDIIVRSLKAGHPVPVAISMVAREMPDPIGSEFGMVSDEVTYGADLETAMRNLYFRVGQDDLPLFVTAVAIQGSTGGNLSEILGNLSAIIRLRFKMRRKVKALAAEGKFSAIILSGLPIAMFAILQSMTPDFYGKIWHVEVTKIVLGCAAAWMAAGNYVMYRLVNFRI